ncbi:anion permease [Halobacteriovorax sp. HLS]|uniref:anion permease n=1 Tax=Halobacteriovorax sp. HLS TaxID=2234000 RepID=UPI000FD8FEE1|nr:anion permease [Halobacteriovorax sp. HLS]
MTKSEVNLPKLIGTIVVGSIIWFMPVPKELDPRAWHLFAIFASTILGIILKAMPMGSMCMASLAIALFTNTLNIKGEALSGFSNGTIWLIVIAFFIARGFIKTGLGNRIAYFFVYTLGKKTLGLSYGLALTDLVLAPATPSNTARAGGIIFPIMKSLSLSYDSKPNEPSRKKIGEFLTLSCFQVDVITSAMFLTSMAANPLIQKFAGDNGVTITWGNWALAGLVPGLVSLLVVPLIIYKLYTPEIKETPNAKKIAQEKLTEMGPISKQEWIMIGVFCFLIIFWVLGTTLGINATVTAFGGLSALLITGVLKWEDIKSEKGAWDTLIWFGVLVMMADFLNKLGFVPWFSQFVSAEVTGLSWMVAYPILLGIYFYSHYMFASATAHVTAMAAVFMAVGIAVGVPPFLMAISLGFFSNLFGCLTHYGMGPAPVLFGSGFVELGDWWKVGFIMSIVNILIWMIIGGAWWKILGLY